MAEVEAVEEAKAIVVIVQGMPVRLLAQSHSKTKSMKTTRRAPRGHVMNAEVGTAVALVVEPTTRIGVDS